MPRRASVVRAGKLSVSSRALNQSQASPLDGRSPPGRSAREDGRKVRNRRWTALLGGALWTVLAVAQAHPAELVIGYLGVARHPPAPVSPLDERATDEGIEGARLGIADTATTGRFTGQQFRLEERGVARDADPVAAVEVLAAAGTRFVVADLDADTLTRVAATPEARELTILNVRAT